jgi:hypothetical protein
VLLRPVAGAQTGAMGERTGAPRIEPHLFPGRVIMKILILCTAMAGLALSSAAADAKGCIKGAIIGGIAGHYAGHGKIGAVAGCVIGRHEANKADAARGEQRPAPQRDQDGHI